MRALTLALGVCVALLIGFGRPARADAPTQKLQRTLGDWVVNGNQHGDTFVVLQAGAVFVPRETVEAFGATGLPAGKTLNYGGDEYVSLDSLAPDLTYTWDGEQHLLTVKIGAAHFAPTKILFGLLKPQNIVYGHALSGFVNYDIHESVAGKTRDGDVSFDSSLAAGPGDFALTGIEGEKGGLKTSDMSYEIDNARGLTDLAFGQVQQNAQTAVSSNLVGLSFGRRFDFDPYLQPAPIPSLTTAITSPSKVYVYVNGRLIKTQDVDPGILDLEQLPTGQGSSGATVVIQDASGKRSIALPFYGSTGNLAAHLSDFFATAAIDPQTHAPAGEAFYRKGLTDAVTADLAAVVDGDYRRAGSAADFRTPAGAFHLAFDASAQPGHDGDRVDARYGYGAGATFLGAEVSQASAGFDASPLIATPGAKPVSVVNLNETLYLGTVVGRSLAPYLRWQRSANADSDASSLTAGAALQTRRAAFTVALVRQTDPHKLGATASMMMHLGRNAVSESYDSSVSGTTLTVQRERAAGTGTTTLSAEVPNLSRVDLDSNATWAKGEYTVDLQRSGGQLDGTADLQSAIGFVGGHVFESQPIEDGFALVRVPGLAGVQVDVGGRSAGRTDASGDILVPGLITGFGNTVKIQDADLPIDLKFDQTQKVVSPIGRSGMLVQFPFARIHAYRGRIAFALDGKQVAPSQGSLTFAAAGKQFAYDLTETGNFFMEDVPVGTHALHIDADQGSCDVTLTARADAASLVNVGTLTCVPKK